MRARVVGIAVGIALAAGCASAPSAPAPGRAGVAGSVRLVPHAAAPADAAPDAYADRRLRDVRLVDYSAPGFTVVYVDGASAPGGDAELAVEDGLAGPRLAPRLAALGAGGTLRIANRAGRAVVLSAPAIGRVARLADGSSAAIRVDRAGPIEIHLLGSDESATVFAAPGPWTRADASGRFALSDLPPGPATLRAWHPRLPPAALEIELRADAVADAALEIGVGRDGGEHGSH